MREFGKKLNDREKLNSSGRDLLLDLNSRYQLERDTLSKKLQGIGGHQTLTPSQREDILFALLQAILRGLLFVELSVNILMKMMLRAQSWGQSFEISKHANRA